MDITFDTQRPKIGKIYKKQRNYRRIIKGCIAGFIIVSLTFSLFLLSFLSGALNNKEDDSKELSLAQQQGKALSIEAVESFLNETPAPLPSGAFVSWDKLTPAPPAGNKNKQESYTIEIHSLTVVARTTGDFFHAEVAVAMSEGGPVVVSRPSLTPYVPVSNKGIKAHWAGGKTISDMDSNVLNRAAQAWAAAYFSGDPLVLTAYVSDKDSTKTFIPMPKAQVEVEVGQSIESNLGEEYAITNISISPIWEVDGKKAAPIEFDCLVVGIKSSAPRIVAWGGAGSGTFLQPYQNGVEGLKIDGPVKDLTQKTHRI